MKSLFFLLLTLSIGYCYESKLIKLYKKGRQTYDKTRDAVINDKDNIKCLQIADRFGKKLGVLESGLSALATGVMQNKELNMKFKLLTTSDPKKEEYLVGDQTNLTAAALALKDSTVIIIHGFLSDGDVSWVQDMANALINWAEKADSTMNVIAVDWSDGGDTFNYVKAAMNTKTAGLQTAETIERLVNKTKEKYNGNSGVGNLHCIGHSLGSHVCSVVANALKLRDEEYQVQRITGLDPARPCFQNDTGKSLKLDKGDAPFVDIVHSNVGRFGKLKSIGHLDFYPNGGINQPGCEYYLKVVNSLSLFPKLLPFSSKDVCDHSRSYVYFTAALKGDCKFLGRPCKIDKTEKTCVVDESSTDFAEMGMNAIKYRNLNGSFYLTIPNTQDFCSIPAGK